MPFRMMRRCLGTASLAGFPWLMAWHDCSVNLGLQWGCRPVPAVRRSLFRQVLLWLIWQSSLLLWGLVPGIRHGSWPTTGGVSCVDLFYLVRWDTKSLMGKEHSRPKARGNPETENSVAAGNWRWRSQSNYALENPEIREAEVACWLTVGGNSSPFNLHFIERGGCNLEALGELRQFPLILLLSALMRRLHTPSF